MTREEAARILDPETTRYALWKYEPETHLAVCDEACRMGADALRAQQERENPKPLTLDELRQMDGEPVWVVWPDGRIKNKWWIVGNYDWNMMEFDDQYTRNNYGKTWLAYRHKPKEYEK